MNLITILFRVGHPTRRLELIHPWNVVTVELVTRVVEGVVEVEEVIHCSSLSYLYLMCVLYHAVGGKSSICAPSARVVIVANPLLALGVLSSDSSVDAGEGGVEFCGVCVHHTRIISGGCDNEGGSRVRFVRCAHADMD